MSESNPGLASHHNNGLTSNTSRLIPHVTEAETADSRKGCSGYAGLQARQNAKRVRAARQHHLQGPRRLLGGWDLRLVEAGLTPTGSH